jgi:hypothetical protein
MADEGVDGLDVVPTVPAPPETFSAAGLRAEVGPACAMFGGHVRRQVGQLRVGTAAVLAYVSFAVVHRPYVLGQVFLSAEVQPAAGQVAPERPQAGVDLVVVSPPVGLLPEP